MLHNIHGVFAAFGISSVDSSKTNLSGRPYGRLAILWSKSISPNNSFKPFEDNRLIGIEINTLNAKLLI